MTKAMLLMSRSSRGADRCGAARLEEDGAAVRRVLKDTHRKELGSRLAPRAEGFAHLHPLLVNGQPTRKLKNN